MRIDVLFATILANFLHLIAFACIREKKKKLNLVIYTRRTRSSTYTYFQTAQRGASETEKNKKNFLTGNNNYTRQFLTVSVRCTGQISACTVLYTYVHLLNKVIITNVKGEKKGVNAMWWCKMMSLKRYFIEDTHLLKE